MVIKKIALFLFCSVFLSQLARAELSKVEYIDGSVDRVYETKSGEWTAFILVKDSMRKSFKCLIDPSQTLIKKGPQILSLSELNAGTKVIVVARPEISGDFKASVIQIKDPILR